jgi:LysM repeat protein
MVRGLFLLAGFAVVIGLCAYWGPLKLPPRNEQPRVVVEAAPASDHAETSTVAPADEPAYEHQPERPTSQPTDGAESAPVTHPDSTHPADSPPEPAAREPVVAMRPPVVSAIDTLPAKTTPGFPPAPDRSLSNEHMAAAIKQAKVLRAQGMLVESRDSLSELYVGHRLAHEQRVRIAEELEPLSWQMFTSHKVTAGAQLYEVQHGDTLTKLARPFHVPHEFIMRINRLQSARAIQPRQTLKFVQGPFDVLVELDEFECSVLHQGKFVRRFSIGLGTDETPTPTGLFAVCDKQVNPKKWPDPVDRRTIPGGSPENPLGSRWIAIGLGYGIHGTNDPKSIGQKASRGCIRMKNEDVEQLYDMLVEGSRVLIR